MTSISNTSPSNTSNIIPLSSSNFSDEEIIQTVNKVAIDTFSTIASADAHNLSIIVPKSTGLYKNSIEENKFLPLSLTNPYGIDSKQIIANPQNFAADATIDIQIIAPAEAREKPMPILIFSNGLTEHSLAYEPLLKNIASHGYVVLNIDHTSSSQPDSKYPENPSDEYISALASVQANNIQFVMEQIQNGSLSLPAGSQINNITLGGHSMGGAASFLVSEKNIPSIKGCIDLDGDLISIGGGTKTGENLKIPSLLIHADYAKIFPNDPKIKNMLEDYEVFHKLSQHSIMPKPVEGIIHMSFCQASFSDHTSIEALHGKTMRDSAFIAYNEASKHMLDFMKTLQ